MKRSLAFPSHALVSLLLASCVSVQDPVPPQAGAPGAEPPAPSMYTQERPHHLNFYIGDRTLGDGFWKPLDEQFTFGMEYANDSPGRPIGWEIGVMASGDVQGSFHAYTDELYGGIRHTFPVGNPAMHPFIGGGLSIIYAELKAGSLTRSDESLATYLHGGIVWDLSEAFFIGFDVRFLGGSDLRIGAADTDADYGQFAFMLGTSF